MALLFDMSTFSASFLFAVVVLLHASLAFSVYHEPIARELKGESRRHLQAEPCRTGNPIDDCWRCDPDWDANRKMLANCAVGFGRNAIGGQDGEIYVVTDSTDDDPTNPTPGTLRYATIQEKPLWIIFSEDMTIQLKSELIMNSYKTIDGRGANIEISNGPCIAIHNVSNVIIHNIHIYNCLPSGATTMVRDKPNHIEWKDSSDGDGISIKGSRDVWIDHCTMANCRDGLIDVVHESTAVTISNNYMFQHNLVMLMGHSDEYVADRNMQVTIAFNNFGEGLVQRMPRCRHGYFHIVNNIYNGWEMYAIGGSANPTINSQGNIFIASNDSSLKEVTKREGYAKWDADWNWRSDGDLMYNGAYFTPSGEATSSSYTKASSMVARPASLLVTQTPSAGVIDCNTGSLC